MYPIFDVNNEFTGNENEHIPKDNVDVSDSILAAVGRLSFAAAIALSLPTWLTVDTVDQKGLQSEDRR